MTLTQKSGTLAPTIRGNRDIQRIGFLVSSSGTRNLCYYDPASNTIFYDVSSGDPLVDPTINQE